MKTLNSLINMRPFEGYLYAYPHKTAYRPFHQPLKLEEVWKDEDLKRLFLYIHIPFCEMRCGFCNLFTLNGQKINKASDYLSAMRREAETISNILPDANFSQIAIGGGTPTFLNIEELEDLFDIIALLTQEKLPFSIESSPGRTTPEHLKCLEAHGVNRISLGVESFSQVFLKAMGRPEKAELSKIALDNIRLLTSANLNIDLIYGSHGQTVQDFETDIATALEWQPEQVFLYPLYVGNLTGLARTRSEAEGWDEQRLKLYRHGREQLLSAGYQQVSQRKFIKTADDVTDYSCQEDGMVGLGAGARSYTKSVHYSWDYAVGRKAIAAIIDKYSDCRDFSKIRHGIQLSFREEQRRYVIKSVLNRDGLDLARFKKRFGIDAVASFKELEVLLDARYLVQDDQILRPTSLGFERADAMGPFLISSDVEQSMKDYQWA